jgi:hypothetical protein
MLHRVGGHATHSSTSVVRRIPKIRGREDKGTDGTTPNEIGRGCNGSASKDKAHHARALPLGVFPSLPLDPPVLWQPVTGKLIHGRYQLQESSSCLNAIQTCRPKHKLLNLLMPPVLCTFCSRLYDWRSSLLPSPCVQPNRCGTPLQARALL